MSIPDPTDTDRAGNHSERPDDDPAIWPGPSRHCACRREAVTDDDCLACFTRPQHGHLRRAYRLRTHCRDQHIDTHGLGLIAMPAPQPDDAEVQEAIAGMIDGMSPDSLRAALKNILMVADYHRDEDTAVAVARQIRAHAEYEARHGGEATRP